MSASPQTPGPALGPIQPPDDRALQLIHELEISSDLNCHQVGTIQAFNAATQLATIQIVMTRQIAGVAVPYPLLVNCPVVVLKGGKAYMTFPIAVGDECLVLFNDRDIDNWWESSQTTLPPNSQRIHALSDGFAIPGISSKKNAIANYSTTAAVFGFNGDTEISLFSNGVTADSYLTILSQGKLTIHSNGSSIPMTANSVTLVSILDALMAALTTGWTDTNGDTPSGPTLTALGNVQTSLDAFFHT